MQRSLQPRPQAVGLVWTLFRWAAARAAGGTRVDIILGQTNYYRAAAEVAALEELALISLPTLLAALQGALLDVCLSVPGKQAMPLGL